VGPVHARQGVIIQRVGDGQVEPGVPLKENLVVGGDFLEHHAAENGIRRPPGKYWLMSSGQFSVAKIRASPLGRSLKSWRQGCTHCHRIRTHHAERLIPEQPGSVAFFPIRPLGAMGAREPGWHCCRGGCPSIQHCLKTLVAVPFQPKVPMKSPGRPAVAGNDEGGKIRGHLGVGREAGQTQPRGSGTQD